MCVTGGKEGGWERGRKADERGNKAVVTSDGGSEFVESLRNLN